jgi:tryptophan 2,3-dioxygenase
MEQPGVIVPLPDMVPTSSELPPEGCPVMAGTGEVEHEVLYYWDYLHLDELLNSQTPKSAERGGLVHDEIFFIVVHQTYELWFKQILVELDSVLDLMSPERIPERDLGIILSRLQRINSIQQLLVGQFDILETMTPLDFLDFRSMLLPASGFQSVQFRLIENKFGLLEKDRVRIEGHSYSDTLRADHVALVVETENSPSLFDHLERWLARTPFVRTEDFDFVATYRQVAKAKHDATRASLQGKPDQLATFEQGIRKFDALFEKVLWDQEMQQGSRRLSYEAFMAALFINLYRDEPILHIPYLILTALVDIDETFTMWRQRHALMAHRMLGRLTGTAGSGYDYLDETAKTYTPFRDLFDVATYLLPRPLLPRLPEALVSGLDFRNE